MDKETKTCIQILTGLLLIVIMIFVMYCISINIWNQYQITYKIYYPGNTTTKTVVSQGLPSYESYRGSNALSYKTSYFTTEFIETSAPIEITSCIKLP